MNRVLRFKQTESSKVWLTSDWHYNHNPKWPVPIWKMRGYNSVNEMNVDIIKSINDNVGVNDILINAGDPTLNCSESEFESLLSQIICQTVYMMWGNHSSPSWGIYQREVNKLLNLPESNECVQEIYPLKYRNTIFVGNYLEISVDGFKSVVSHYPLSSWNGMSHNSLLLHGHIHSTKENYKLDGKTIDVGFDYWKRPVSFDEIKLMMDKVPRKIEGHH